MIVFVRFSGTLKYIYETYYFSENDEQKYYLYIIYTCIYTLSLDIKISNYVNMLYYAKSFNFRNLI